MVNIIYLILGAVLLVAGRRLFWLLVGGIGFVIGATLATRFFHGNDLTVILAGLVLGIIFAVLAIFLESVAIGIAGFLGGGYVFLSLAGMLGLDRGGLSTWIIFVLGGVLGVVLVAFLFGWALITISSLAGASMIVAAVGLTAVTAGLIYLGLVVAGVLIQGTSMRRESREAA
ncbi:MAG TPA: DUF4203 domain-containing protein [Anaerolineales bacterium]|nr:DUF4203 domain-containing protein [Anaerolineales bacterium]